MTTPVIVGAGLAGLIAAHAWPNLPVLEASADRRAQHRALLRFRSDSVAKLTGIEFKPVTVRKGVWAYGSFVAPTIQLANQYSRKCLGRLEPERSIWKLEPAQRWIAPDNLYEQLVESVGSRISWGVAVDYANLRRPAISTAPLPAVLDAVGLPPATLSRGMLAFDRSPIIVKRATVANCELYQTVYFPQPDTTLYRASITGDTLIAEFVGEPSAGWLVDVCEAFGITDATVLMHEATHKQAFGKIAPIDDVARKSLLWGLTHQHSIYSLGRFATWRNILLDDVVDDIPVIKRLMRGDNYERAKVMR